MLHSARPGQAAGAASQERPSVGSLFVPSRVSSSGGSSTACRIAGLQRQPGVDDLVRMGGLLLPPQVQQERQQQAVSAPPAPPAAAPALAAKPKLRLSWAGSGVYFWWQLGAVQYLMSRYALGRVPMVGASGGGLAAVLAACEVEPEAVMDSALALSKAYGIWERPLGLMGCWGGVIEQWLHDLLPPDAAQRCSGQVGLVVTQLPRCNQVLIDAFADKGDLVNVAMASAHVPLFLDWKVARECRGVPCVDGSFPDFFSGVNCDALTCGGDALVFDYFDDPAIVRNGRLDMLELKELRQFKKIITTGYRYAQRLHESGAFERFDTSGVARRP